MEKMIQAQQLTFEYQNESEGYALSNVDVTIPQGQFVAVLGHNGSGKSTLAKHFNAILLPSGGRVLVDGLDTADQQLLYEIRQRVGMVFQNPDNQLVATIVEEDVAFAPENLGVPSAEIRQRVDDALKAVGMTEYTLHAPHMLSGGQKQRIAIAGVLAMQPDYLVLDEPTAMLDPIGRREVLATLKKLNKKRGMTIVLITHNMDEAVQADRVIVMDRGEMVLDDLPKNVFSKVPHMKELGLDVPQVTELIYLLGEQGADLPGDVLNVDEAQAVLAQRLPQEYPPLSLPDNLPSTGQVIIKADHLFFDYSVGAPFETQALYNVSLEIKKGELIGIIGHTGSGKSTLVQQFNGLLKPTRGTLLVDGVDLSLPKLDLRNVRRRVGLVFQYPEHQLFEETVRLDIGFSPRKMGLSAQQVEQRVERAIALAGVPADLLDKSPFELSGGQKRRVAIAGVLAMEPEVLVLDEPTAGLDPRGREEILQQIKQMHAMGMTIVLVSHSMEDVANTVERMYVMRRGQIALEGTPLDVYANHEELAEIGLGIPQVTDLLYRLCGVNVCTVPQAVDYLLPLLTQGGAAHA